MIITNENAKTIYDYERVFYGKDTETDLRRFIELKKVDRVQRKKSRGNNLTRYLRTKTVGKSNKHSKIYIDCSIAFDIETTTLKEERKAVMYTWQLGVNNNVIHGREWWQFIQTLNLIKKILRPTQNQRVICWIANLGFETQFMKHYLNITDSFLKSQRQPCYIEHDGWLVFQDALLMTSSNLAKLAKDYTNTQKCVGDLDYSIERGRHTKIYDKEYRYNDNDVLILTEWADYFYNTYIVNHVKPLTATGVLASEIKDYYEKFRETIDSKWFDEFLRNSKPTTELEYNIVMNYLYRGGYTHANELYVDRLFTEKDNIASYDFTSSYPSVILYNYYPSEWKPSTAKTQEDIEKLNKKYCVWGRYHFYNIKSTTTQSIESKSKCVELKQPVIDNGRVHSAKEMVVYLTELDYATYSEFYVWDKLEVSEVMCSKRVKCPKYLIEPMLKYYILKDKLKKEGKPYAVEKGKVNTFYGYTVKKLNTAMHKLTNEGYRKEDAKPYDEQMKAKPTSPYIGVYVSAHARRNLLKSVYALEKIGRPVLYCDTDSIKILNHDEKSQRIIDLYNEDIARKRDRACQDYNINKEDIYDLGMFDAEYTKDGKTSIFRFKTLGAKRYIVSYIGFDKDTNSWVEKDNQTICGLPKNILCKIYDRDTMYEKFEDNLAVEFGDLVSVYIDEPFDVMVDGKLHHEESAIALIPQTYHMKLDGVWVETYLKMQSDEREKRIYG